MNITTKHPKVILQLRNRRMGTRGTSVRNSVRPKATNRTTPDTRKATDLASVHPQPSAFTKAKTRQNSPPPKRTRPR